MKYPQKQSGFSLMEVMLAVAILAMGLTFIASMFPLGISNTRRVARNTTIGLTRMNSAATMDLQFESFRNQGLIGYNQVYNPSGLITVNKFIGKNNHVNYLMQPNVRVDSIRQIPFGGVDPEVIFDDPTNFYFPRVPVPTDKPPYVTYPYNDGSTNIYNNKKVPSYYDLINGHLAPTQIGRLVYPPVDISDPEVISRFKEYQANGIACLPEDVVYEVALERKYSTAAFYMTLESDNLSLTRLYVFTFERVKDDPRYAVQDGSNYQWQETFSAGKFNLYRYRLDPLPASEDRHFPVPWLVRLDTIGNLGYDYFTLDSSPEGLMAAELLRKGSYIIDADTPYDRDIWDGITPKNGLTNMGRGSLYKIADIQPDYDLAGNQVGHIVSLDSPLMGGMRYFWVFPPAIERNADGTWQFETKQPVIDVIVKMLRI